MSRPAIRAKPGTTERRVRELIDVAIYALREIATAGDSDTDRQLNSAFESLTFARSSWERHCAKTEKETAR